MFEIAVEYHASHEKSLPRVRVAHLHGKLIFNHINGLRFYRSALSAKTRGCIEELKSYL